MDKSKMIDKGNVEDIVALTSLQKGMLFHYLKDPAGDYYFEQLSLDLTGRIDRKFFDRAWQFVIDGNDVLRSLFLWEKAKEPVRVVLKNHSPELRYVDLSISDENGTRQTLEEIKEKDRNEKFDLSFVPFRVTLCKLADDKYCLIISNHHILYDGWSNGIILKEFFQAYDDLHNGVKLIKREKTKFKEFVKWVQGRDKDEQQEFWADYLAGYEGGSELSIKKRTNGNTSCPGHCRIPFTQDIKEKLEQFALNSKVTTASVLYAAWGILLQRYNNCTDVIFGTTVSGRSAKINGIENMAGLFINTPPLRVTRNGDEKIETLLRQVDNGLKIRESFESTSLSKIKSSCLLDNNAELFDSIVVIENYPLDARLAEQKSRLTVKSYSMVEKTHYDLSVIVKLFDEMTVELHYSDLLEEETVKRLADHFSRILQGVITDPVKPVCLIDMLSPQEKRELLYDFNDTDADFPGAKTIYELFKTQVERIPDNIAVVSALSNNKSYSPHKTNLTYEQLNRMVARMSSHLRARGVTPGSIVGIMAERSIEMVAGILGILKAGGAYLPIEPDYPADRIQYITTDSGAQILLTRQDLTALSMPRTDAAVACDEPQRPSDPAYIIYTSGSTGRPKGVMVTQGSAVNLLMAMADAYPPAESDVYLLKTSFMFDVSATELFGWFIGGCSLAILEPGGEKDPQVIVDTVEKAAVTHINFVPTMFNAFLDWLTPDSIAKLSSLKFIFLAGEAILPEHVNKFRQLNTGIRLENLYGPTEATVYACGFSLAQWDGMGGIPIGKPMSNMKLHILDRDGNITPVGVPGELIISGSGVASGYINRPGLTAEKFISLPLYPAASIRAYRTGDLVRRQPGGIIEFLGRIDHQVKIRGFRIELEEIESLLLEHEQVKEVKVIAVPRAEGEKYLCAYVTVNSSDYAVEQMAAELKEYLSLKVPEYMIPSYFVKIEKMPLGRTGKIDYKMLPAPEITIDADNEKPTGEIEEKLAAIWAQVLGVETEKIAANAGFFVLGGDSLKAINVMSNIHRVFNVKIPLNQLFKTNTIRGLSRYIGGLAEDKFHSIKPVEKKEYYAPSSAQKRLYVLQQLDTGNITYNTSAAIMLEGRLDMDKLKAAFTELIKRHESLRTSFRMEAGEPVQVIHEKVEFEIEVEEMKGSVELTMKNFVRPFDLARAPLMRVGLIKMETGVPGSHLLLLDAHHIVVDGESVGVFIHDFMTLYANRIPAALKIQYKDFSHWQSLNRQDRQQQESYWLKQYEGEIPVLNLPTDYRRPPVQSFEGGWIDFEVGEDETEKLKELALKENSTLYMVLLSLFNILLAKLSGQEDIIVGSPTSGRNHIDVKPLIGMFVNTLALRNFPVWEKTFTSFLREVTERTLKAFENQDVPFEDLVEKLDVRRDAGRNPLFDCVFVMHNVDFSVMELPGLKLTHYDYKNPVSKFDITLNGTEVGGKLHFTFEYCTKLFAKETVGRFVGAFKQLVSGVIENPGDRLSELSIVTMEDKKLLYKFNDTAADYPRDKTIHELFETQVEKTPDHIAVVGALKNNKSYRTYRSYLTYKQLNQTATQLSSHLRERGVTPGSIVGIMAERSAQFVVGIMAILKAGGVYLPIDPGFPEERKQYMLADSGAKIVLTQRDLDDVLTLCADAAPMPENVPVRSADPAYIIYTSGSTGRPKGVLVEHRSLVNLCCWHNRYYKVTGDDKAGQFAASVFDASVWEIFPYLLKGAALHIISDEIKTDTNLLNDYLESNGITIAFMPTQYCEQFMELPNHSLTRLLTGGDVLHRVKKRAYALYNNYGPTENTVVTTACRVEPEHEETGIPIGKPIDNVRIYILEHHSLQVQPVGVAGELCVAGDGLAAGYINNPELTAERFSPLPRLSTAGIYVPSTPIYRTGDLAHRLLDGNIEFLGRIDHQVKIRGYRIELEEIESCLMQMDTVDEAVVIEREDPSGRKCLCAYVVLAGKDSSISALKEFLSARLPGYMIPSVFIPIEKIPVTTSGKVDRKALPEPRFIPGESYTAPRDDVEGTLVETWQQVLGIERIGIDDDFFKLGGDSIKAIQVSSRLLQAGMKLDVSDLFKNPCIRQLRGRIRCTKRHISQDVVTGEVPLTPIQKWFFHTYPGGGSHFNQAVMIYRKDGFDVTILRKVFSRIVEHHDALRMVYGVGESGVIQNNRGVGEKLFDLRVFDLGDVLEPELEEAVRKEADRLQREIDLGNGPLVISGLFRTRKGDHLAMVIHHLVVDGVSWRIILEDIADGYNRALKGKPIVFAEKTDSFQTWSHKLAEYAKSKAALREIPFWKELEETKNSVSLLPKDHEIEKGERNYRNVGRVVKILDDVHTSLLLFEVNQAYNTEINDILLTALGMAVKEWAGLGRIAVNLEGHGRESIIEGVDIGRTVGWFTTQFPIILDMSGETELSYRLKSVKEMIRRIPNKGIGYGILKYLTPVEPREELSFTGEPEICFNYLGQFGLETESRDSAFGFSPLPTGECISPDLRFIYSLDIGGLLVEGKLHLNFSYNQFEYKQNTIDRLADFYHAKLVEIIEHCSKRKKREFTPSDLGYSKLSLEEFRQIEDVVGKDTEILRMYPLAPMQTGMLFHLLEDKTSHAYFEQTRLTMEGDLDIPILEQSAAALVDRYDILRTVFLYEGLGEPLQVVLNRGASNFRYEDISQLRGDEKALYLERFQEDDKKKGFDFSHAPLMRFSVFKNEEQSYELIWSYHHILMDGWCMGILYDDLLQIYRHLKEGQPLQLEPAAPYGDFINWLILRDEKEGLTFWLRYLEGYEQHAGLPGIDKPAAAEGRRFKEGKHVFKVGETLSQDLRGITQDFQVTLNTLFQSAWGILLQRYNNTDDVVFGSVVSGRTPEIEGIERMVGLFINTVPVRIRVEEGTTFSQLLNEVQQDALGSKSYEYVSLADIQSNCALKRGLLDHVLVFENYPLQDELKESGSNWEGGFSITAVESSEQTNYDFNIIVIPGQNLTVELLFNSYVFETELIERIASHLGEVLRRVAANPGILVEEINILPHDEKQKVLYDFNDTAAVYPEDKTIHALFEAQVGRTPDHTAVVSALKNNKSYRTHRSYMTYNHLNQTAAQLSLMLRERGVTTGSIVGIMVERSVQFIIGIMAILKAGGAYLPIDPGFPEERKQFMMTDSGAQVLLTQQDLNDVFTGSLDTGPGYGGGQVRQRSSDPAYVIYTSGSTGKPKGVLVEHRSLVNLCCWHNRYYKVTGDDKAGQFAASVFDASVWEIFPYLLKGAALHIISDEIKTDTNLLNDYIESNGITIAFMPTQYCEQFMELPNHSLTRLLTGGDVLHRVKKRDYELYNNYGPTENTVVTTACRVEQDHEETGIPIGKPIANNRIYIIDGHSKQLQPVGVAGEVCIAGDGLAAGYINNPELTAERFTTLPFIPSDEASDTAAPVYRTGDLVRWLPDGNIEFLGRIDNQVKIRGYRVELEEIESCLMQMDTVNEAVVVARENTSGWQYLCAYIVQVGEAVGTSGLKEYLSARLPGYMIPSVFIPMEKIPVTTSGKVDRNALPEPEFIPGESYTAPRDDVEGKLVETWQQVLGIERIGIDDDFFTLGGDSIKAIQVSSRLLQAGMKLDVSDLFKNPCIRQLRDRVRCSRRRISQDVVTGDVPLTPIQKWFFHTYPGGLSHFNQAVMIYRSDGFDVDILDKIFTRVVEHHDALRMVYELSESGIIQGNRGIGEKLFDLRIFDLGDVSEPEVEEAVRKEADRLQREIDLVNGPLVILGLFKTSKGDHLSMVIHHLVVDGVSWRIILEDIADGYNRALKGEPVVFAEKTDSFQTWARKLVEYAGSKEVLKELSFWKELEEAKDSVSLLPKDFETENGEKNRGNVGRVVKILDDVQTSLLLFEVNRAYNTEINDILLTALGMAVKEWAGLERIAVSLEGHGRESIIEGVDIDRTVGWFTTQFPIILDMSGETELSYRLKSVKEMIRRIPNKGIGYGILKYLTAVELREELSFTGEPEISFNYLGQFDLEAGLRNSAFEFSPLPTGECISPQSRFNHSLDIGGLLVEGKLHLNFSYNQFEYKQNTIERLADFYHSKLVEIIEHCSERKKREFTPSDLGYGKLSLEELRQIEDVVGNDTDILRIYPLAPMQTGMLFHLLEDKTSHAYFEQIRLTMEGNLDIPILEKSAAVLVDRYDILRTVFLYEGLGEPLQVVLNRGESNFRYEDISHLRGDERTLYLERFQEEDKKEGFDFSRAPLMRFSVFKNREQSFELIWSYHHILMDGWCMGILYDDLLQIYRHLKEGQPLQLEPAAPYGDFINWLILQDEKEGLTFWLRYLEGYEQHAGLPGIRKPAAMEGKGFKEGKHVFEVGETLALDLRGITQEYQVTLNTLFQSVWGILLQRYNNTDDVVFGTVVSGRTPEIEGIERMVGLFINTVPVRIRAAEGTTFSQLLNEVQQDALESKSYEYVSLADIQSNCALKRGLLDHVLVFENYPLQDELKESGSNWEGGFSITAVESSEQTNYDFNLVVIPGQNLTVELLFNSYVFETELIERIASHLGEVIHRVAANPGILVEEIDILPYEEKQKVLYDFNDTAADYPRNKTIHVLFEEQVEKTPDSIAVVGDHKNNMSYRTHETHKSYKTHLTYKHVNQTATQLSLMLRERGVTPGSIVGILAERSTGMVAGLLGILKAGAAYLPIDPGFPEERKQYMLSDSGASIVLTHQDLTDGLFLCADFAPVPESVPVRSTDLAYIIYTSGSTGRPKGVLVEHRGVVNVVTWFGKTYNINTGTRVLQLTEYTFDPSVEDIFATLIYGGTLFTGSMELLIDRDMFCDYVDENVIHIINFIPTMLKELLCHERKLESLRAVVCGGEALPESTRNEIIRRGYHLYNHYGPTETTVDALAGECSPGPVHLGKPVANTNCYVLDTHRRPVPIGVPGELYIRGAGVARGYLNSPELTAERFTINKSFSGVQGAPRGAGDLISMPSVGRDAGQLIPTVYPHLGTPSMGAKKPLAAGGTVYRTGDLGCWLSDGSIRFLGRIDTQVKIRGYRIELGEIENRLSECEKVKDVVLMAREEKNGGVYLCAYVVPSFPGEKMESALLRQFLNGKLPDYMIPSQYVFLDDIPLTFNGKVDYKVLPEPVFETGEDYIAPRDGLEETLVEIWAEVLGIEKGLLGIHDNFFDAGGNSIKIIKLSSRLKQVLGKDIPVVTLFQFPSVGSLAGYLKSEETGTDVRDLEAEEKKMEESENLLLDAIQLLGDE